MKSVLVGLLIVIVVLIECMAGGTRLALALPCYMLLGVAALLALFQRPPAEARARPSCLIISAAFFTYILIRASRSPVTYLWWHDFYMVMACLIVYLITIFYVTGTRQRRVFIWALLGLAVLEVIFGIRQFVHGDDWMPLGFTRAFAGRRASGTLISSIHLAGYLEVVGLFALSFAFWSAQRIWARILAGYLALMCYGGVAITGSRGGYLSTFASIVVFAALSLHAIRASRPKRFLPALLLVGGLVVIGLCGGVAVMSQNEFLRSRLSTIPKQLDRQHLDIRIYNWQAALDHFRVEPVLGTGAGTHLHYGRVFRRPPLQSDPIHAHNDYLELLAEYGIIGGLGMALFLAVHLRSGWKIYSSSLRELRSAGEWVPARDDSLALTIGAFSAISAYLVHSISDFNLHIPGHALIFAFIFGILVSPARDLPAVRSTWATGLFRWALLPLGGWILAFSLHAFGGEYWAEKARYAFRETDFTNSIAHANKALVFHEENYELFFYLGNAHRGLALIEEEPPKRVPHLEAATKAFVRCLALFPQDVHALVRLAQTLAELGRFKEAEAIYRGVLQLDPNLARGHAYYASHLARVGRHEEAKAQLARALELSPFEDYQPIVRGTSLDPAVHTP